MAGTRMRRKVRCATISVTLFALPPRSCACRVVPRNMARNTRLLVEIPKA